MNQLIQMGRLTKDPETRQAGETQIAQFTIAVDKRYKKDSADFFTYTAFGKLAEFVGRYLVKGTKVLVYGRVENNNYTKQDGTKVYGFQFLAEGIEFAESKKAQQAGREQSEPEPATGSGWMNVPDNVDDEGLPFN